MTTLEDRAQEVRRRVVDRGRKQAGQQLVQRIVETTARANRSVDRLETALQLKDAMGADGIDVKPLDRRATETGKKARTNLRSTATKLDGSELSDDEALRSLNGRAFQEGLRGGEELVDRLVTLLVQALEAERRSLLTPEVQQPIPDVPGQAAAAAKLSLDRRTLSTPVALKADDLADSGRVFLDTRRKLAAAATRWSELYPQLRAALADESPDVRRFLEAAAQEGGAPLDLLTDRVRERLREKELLDEFRIRRQG